MDPVLVSPSGMKVVLYETVRNKKDRKRLRETRRDCIDMATTLNMGSQMGFYTRKEKVQVLGQLVKWTVGEI